MLCLEARAKINWTLDILGTRADGYHLMDMLMQSVALHDTLWLEPARELTLEAVQQYAGEAWDAANMRACTYTVSKPFNANSTRCDSFSSSSVSYDQHNLVYRVAERLREHAGVTLGARMQLLKRIPAGAGMGGGSADAAAALIGLNELWGLKLDQETLLNIGLSLGADVPFMLTGGLARVGGIGEQITKLIPPKTIWLVLLQPCDGLSTREVFYAFDALPIEALQRPQTSAAQHALEHRDLAMLASSMNNVLENVSLKSRPAMATALWDLAKAGALRTMMTGSGSVVYGLFDKRIQAEHAQTLLCQAYPNCYVTNTENSGITRV